MRVDNVEIRKVEYEKLVHLEIEHPVDNSIDTVEIGLCSVRASDDIRIKYDFDRGGWVIYQPKGYFTEVSRSSGRIVEEYHEEWIESAFCPSWKNQPEDK
ncbi:hypothetical protein FDJ58_gp057 [Bacillus phage SIOphi]|uniref:Uncharacterized protein n=1 Tax=Bacillus phage SIOphi TaxID=1285382 RepID=R4JMM1_9CAUD|nr:hypothetical protein FDJ58_gp057 [Bacillus phage SIOphi]AGK86865.1 hypothetical protein SIOphi_00285 [Bacillus phage SIOphi]